MDKKVVIFFSLFALLMIGGSLVLSLWVIPKVINPVWPYDVRVSRAGMIQPDSENVTTSADHGPRNETKVSWKLMITQMIGAICIVLLVGMRLKKWFRQTSRLIRRAISSKSPG